MPTPLRLTTVCSQFRLFWFGLALALAWLLGGNAWATALDDTIPTQHANAPLTRPVVDPKQALKKATARLQRETVPAQVAAAHLSMAEAMLALRRYNQAARQCSLAMGQYQRARQAPGMGHSLQLLGRIRFAQGDTGKARSIYQQALRQYASISDRSGQARVQEHLGDLYASRKAWPLALVSYERAYSTWKAIGNQRNAAVALHAIGRMHFENRQYSRALYYLRIGAQQARALQDSTGVGYVLRSTGQVYATLGNDEMALGFYSQALEQLPRRSTPPDLLAGLYQAIATAHDSLDNANAAERYLLRAMPLVQQSGSKVWLSESYQRLAAVYRRQGRYREAVTALTRHISLQDSAAAEQRAAQVAELRTRYETEKKEREIQLLTKNREIQEANLRRQKLARNMLAVGALLLLLAVGALYRGRQEQRRINRLLERKNAAISRQKEELDRLNRTKDTLFSVISHDLRSPLSSLYSLLSLLNLGTLPPEKLAAHSDRLTRTLDTTLRLLDNLLNWAATQMQGAGPRPERIRLDAVTEESLALLLGDAERKSIMLLSHLREPYYARADLNMARLIIRNLVGNAIKFTPAGGTITVSAQRRGMWWEVAVRDTGVGIPAADIEKVFGEAGPHTTLGTARERGTGLGLRLCKDFVERNGGRLSVESEVGQGSVFRFTLPAAEPEPMPEQAEETGTGVAASASADAE